VFYKCPKTQVSSPDPSHIAALSKSSKRPKSQSLDCSQWLEDLWCCLMLHKISKETCLTMCHQWHGLQAEGRCRFFKWQDELGNGPTAPQQQSGPAAQQPAVPSPQGMNAHGNRMSNKAQGVPAAAAGGSGVFADEGELMKRRFGSSMKNLAASMSMGSNILVLMHDALVCHCPCLSLFRELLLVHAAPQHKRWCSAGCALTLAVDSELELNAVASGAFRCCYLLFAPV